MQAKRYRWLCAAMVCAGLALGAGCSDDDSSGNNNVVPDAAVDAATGDTVQFRVETYDTGSATFVPVAGVLVAFDAPGGERTEVTTGADGMVTFEGVDWSLGTAAVTAYLADYAMTSWVNLTEALYNEATQEYQIAPIGLQKLAEDPVETVTLSGTATAMEDTAHKYDVNIPATLVRVDDSEWAGTGTQDWEIDVPVGETFVLQAVEFERTSLPSGQGYTQTIYQWMQMDYGPVTADESDIELDFDAYGMTTFSADVSVLMPTRTDSPLRTGNVPYCYVCADTSNYCHGWPTYLDVVDNHNRIDLSFTWVDPDYVNEANWFCYVGTQSGELGQVTFPGYPTQDQEETLIDAPTWVTPADPSVAHDLHAPMEWTWYEDVNRNIITIQANSIDRWLILAGPDARTATVPEPPTGVVLSTLIGANPTAKIFGGTMDEERGTWARVAMSRGTRIAP